MRVPPACFVSSLLRPHDCVRIPMVVVVITVIFAPLDRWWLERLEGIGCAVAPDAGREEVVIAGPHSMPEGLPLDGVAVIRSIVVGDDESVDVTSRCVVVLVAGLAVP